MAKKAEKKEEKVVVVSAEQKVMEITKDLGGFEKKQPRVAKIENEKGLEKANEFLVDVKGRVNRIKALKEEYVTPLKDAVKKVESLFNEPLKSYEEIEGLVKRGISDFRLEQDRLAKIEADKIKKQQEEAAEKAKEQGEPAPVSVAPMPSIQKPETHMKTDNGSSSSSKVVKFEVTDPNELPKKYKDLILEEAFKKGIHNTIIRKVVATEGMKTNIKGVRVFEDYQVSVSA